MPGHVLLETVAFEEQSGQTKVTATVVFMKADDHEGMLVSGMENGAVESWERVEEYLRGDSLL